MPKKLNTNFLYYKFFYIIIQIFYIIFYINFLYFLYIFYIRFRCFCRELHFHLYFASFFFLFCIGCLFLSFLFFVWKETEKKMQQTKVCNNFFLLGEGDRGGRGEGSWTIWTACWISTVKEKKKNAAYRRRRRKKKRNQSRKNFAHLIFVSFISFPDIFFFALLEFTVYGYSIILFFLVLLPAAVTISFVDDH